jgi:hypothetical protein
VIEAVRKKKEYLLMEKMSPDDSGVKRRRSY